MTESKTILVTGAARGIGLAIAQGLAEAGHKVVAADYDKAVLEDTPFDGVKLAGDVSSPADAERMVADTVAAHGSLDVLVNNAGLGMGLIREDHFTNPIKITEVTPEVWQSIFAVNAMGPFLMTRAATPGMVERGWGRVVNITTSFFTMLNVGFVPYSPAKAALESASAIWAKEFDGSGVAVNVVVPGGPTDTRMVPAETGFSREELIPVTAMVPPIRWLADAASDGVNGRRFIGSLWNADLPDAEAAEIAGAPTGWPTLTSNVVWPGDPPT